jgi:hypothetical protein
VRKHACKRRTQYGYARAHLQQGSTQITPISATHRASPVRLMAMQNGGAARISQASADHLR